MALDEEELLTLTVGSRALVFLVSFVLAGSPESLAVRTGSFGFLRPPRGGVAGLKADLLASLGRFQVHASANSSSGLQFLFLARVRRDAMALAAVSLALAGRSTGDGFAPTKARPASVTSHTSCSGSSRGPRPARAMLRYVRLTTSSINPGSVGPRVGSAAAEGNSAASRAESFSVTLLQRVRAVRWRIRLTRPSLGSSSRARSAWAEAQRAVTRPRLGVLQQGQRQPAVWAREVSQRRGSEQRVLSSSL